MEFLTPELFNMLVVGNLILGLALIIYRFRQDMTRPAPQQHEQVPEDTTPEQHSP